MWQRAHHEKVAAVVYNSTKVDPSTLRSTLIAESLEAGWAEPTSYETTVDDVEQGMAAQALAAGASLIFAAGGDGTVRAVAEVVQSSGIPLALLPSGTGNLLARNLGLTLDDLPDSVRTAFVGIDRPIDIGLIEIKRADGTRDDHAFVVMAGMGIDDLKMTRPGGAWGWLRVWSKVAWTNGVIRRTKAGRAMAGEHKNTSKLHYETGSSFEAQLTRAEDIELDGDEFGEAVGFTARINPGALIIRVPAPVMA